MMKISVIIPIYRVEKFISRCVESLMNQTLGDLEYIFINDATPDNSIKLLQHTINKFPEKVNNCIILHHENNKGLPAARNTGLAVARGEYVFHCDSDDFADPDMLEKMYNTAKETDADIVWCDWYLSFKKNKRYMKQPEYFSPKDALKGMLSGVMKYNVWNKLVRRSLYEDNNIQFPAGYGMGEDMTILRLFARANKVVYIPEAFYHYVKLNDNAFCSSISEKKLCDIKHNVDVVIKDLRNVFGSSLDKELAFFRLDVKFPFLISDNNNNYELWKNWYPEANKYIMQNKQLSLRSRCLQWLASKNQFWAVKLYYKFVYKVIYGIIYH